MTPSKEAVPPLQRQETVWGVVPSLSSPPANICSFLCTKYTKIHSLLYSALQDYVYDSNPYGTKFFLKSNIKQCV